MKRVIWILCLLLIGSLLLTGCGRFRTSGFSGTKPDVRTNPPPADNKLPEKPVLEWGDPDAKVRVIAFFYIHKDYQHLMDVFQDIAKQYQGKVYVKYVDIRTPEGQGMRSRSGGQAGGAGILIDGSSEATIQAKPEPYTVNFDQEMGRYWTEEDLRKVVAQEVALAYKQ